MGVGTLWDGDEAVAPPGFLTDLIAGREQDFIADHADEPWFCMMAFNAVHNFCWQLPDEELQRRGLPAYTDWDADAQPYLEWYDDVVSPNLEHGREYYLAQLELMDAAIGRLLCGLDGRGLAEDTIVIYLTDNGTAARPMGTTLPNYCVAGAAKDMTNFTGRRAGRGRFVVAIVPSRPPRGVGGRARSARYLRKMNCFVPPSSISFASTP